MITNDTTSLSGVLATPQTEVDTMPQDFSVGARYVPDIYDVGQLVPMTCLYYHSIVGGDDTGFCLHVSSIAGFTQKSEWSHPEPIAGARQYLASISADDCTLHQRCCLPRCVSCRWAQRALYSNDVFSWSTSAVCTIVRVL